MITALISRLVILLLGTLYPAYASYKAVRTKDVKEYVKWMMYWIVFALFTCAETFTDVLLGFWFPFYYEMKIGIVLWLLSPATKGSSFLYRNFVHPAFVKRESDIDEYVSRCKDKGYDTVMSLGSRGINYATSVLVQTALKGGGGIFEHIKRSYSLSDLPQKSIDSLNAKSNQGMIFETDATDMPIESRPSLRSRRSASSGGQNIEMYFSEVDVNLRQSQAQAFEHIGEVRSTEDISSGYSSNDHLFNASGGGVLTRTSSVTSSSGRGGRGRGARGGGQARRPLAEEVECPGEEGLDDSPSFPGPPTFDPRPSEPESSTPPPPPVKPDFQSIRNQFEERSRSVAVSESNSVVDMSSSFEVRSGTSLVDDSVEESGKSLGLRAELSDETLANGKCPENNIKGSLVLLPDGAVAIESIIASRTNPPLENPPDESVAIESGLGNKSAGSLVEMLDEIVTVESEVLGNGVRGDKFEILQLSEPMFVRRPRSECGEKPSGSLDGETKSETTIADERKGKYNKLPAPPPPPKPVTAGSLEKGDLVDDN